MTRRAGWIGAGAVLAVVVLAVAAAAAWFGSRPAPVRRTVVLGHSVQQRPVTAVEVRAPGARRAVLVVGCVHGDEQAGVAVANALAAGPPIPGVDLWVVPVLNPDGVAARRRSNANGVDLNRNFPLGWRPLSAPGPSSAGTGPLSEPESALLAALVRRIRPAVGIWFHQQLALVDTSTGPLDVERRLAGLVGLPARPLTVYPGSAVRWEESVVPGSAFVVELPAGSLPPAGVARYADAVRAVTAA